MAVVLTYEVVARYIVERPTIWANDMAIFMFGYCGLLSGAYVLKCDEHIKVDVLYSRFSPRKKAILDLVFGLLVLFFALLVVIYGWKTARAAIIMHELRPTEWAPPAGHFKLMIPIGGFLLLLQWIANWIRNLYRIITNRELRI
jgi:TRAP-type mannitol/chloroaromatic compound transport system permease small subunit